MIDATNQSYNILQQRIVCGVCGRSIANVSLLNGRVRIAFYCPNCSHTSIVEMQNDGVTLDDRPLKIQEEAARQIELD